MVTEVQQGFKSNPLFEHTMKDIYNALEFKLAQARKNRLNVQSSITIAEDYNYQNEPGSGLELILQDEMSLNELQSRMMTKMKKSPRSPQHMINEAEKDSARNHKYTE